jgi:peptidoglycan DL-endopeptidase CwlO
VERLPIGRHHQHWPRSARSRRGGASRRRVTAWTRLTIVTGALALAGVLIPAGVAGAAPATSAARTPGSLKATLAEVNKLSNEIDSLGQQYDALKIQLSQARREAAIARETVRRDNKLLASGQAAIGQIAAEGYMNGTMNPTLQLLQTSNPQQYLNQASIMLQLQRENGDKISVVTTAQSAAKRASLAAAQQTSQATRLAATMHKKVAEMQAKEKTLNSSVYSQALAVFQHTGHYPNINVPGDSIGVQALRWALSRQGDQYVWAAAGPTTFDCSGLTMWAYEHVGIQLDHYTGDQWNEGQHIPRSEMQPGDLILMYGLDHVGMDVNGNLMVDAPTFGQVVQVQQIPWAAVDGVVRIA